MRRPCTGWRPPWTALRHEIRARGELALTFNAHRLHYDRPYATEAEGYPGLVVHGPLIAILLADLARRERPDARVAAFSFKAVRPTFDLRPFRVRGQPSADGKGARLWAQDHEGWLTMQADILFE